MSYVIEGLPSPGVNSADLSKLIPEPGLEKFGRVWIRISRNEQYIPVLSSFTALPKIIFSMKLFINSIKDRSVRGIGFSLLALGRAVVSMVPVGGNLLLLAIDTVASKVFNFQLNSPIFNRMCDGILNDLKEQEFTEDKLNAIKIASPLIQIMKEKIAKMSPEELAKCDPDMIQKIMDLPAFSLPEENPSPKT